MSGCSRRRLLATAGALVVSFALGPSVDAQEAGTVSPAPRARPGRTGRERLARLQGDLSRFPLLDSWIRVDRDGRVTVFTGKAELGQGIDTAIIQVAAEQLDLSPDRVQLVTADTARTPDEGFTAGSHSMQDSATAVMNAAAQVRALLVQEAATHLGVPVARLAVRDGAVVAPDGRSLGYGVLAQGLSLHVVARPVSPLKPPARYRLIGRSLPRVDIPAKITGGVAFVQDLRMPGMVHARVVRPPSYAARLISVDVQRAAGMPGVLKVVHRGRYLAVIATHEWQAIEAQRALEGSARWELPDALPDPGTIDQVLQSDPERDVPVIRRSAPTGPAVRTLEARYTRPYVMHGSIGPSCAVARFAGGSLTVWTHSQGVFPLRRALSQLLRVVPGSIRCIQVEGSGCYGHNGADDAAADAALLARELPGRPVRVQWTREQEHLWEPYGPAMIAQVRAALDAAGRVVEWRYGVWSNTHSTRPVVGGLLLQNTLLPDPLPVPPPRPLPMPEGGGDRNSIPLYELPNLEVVYHFVPRMPLRVSALRALGGQLNVFAIESLMDELAQAVRADPVDFRLRHLKDVRARAVIQAAAQRFGWSTWRARGPLSGRGFGFARYKNLAAYCAVALELSVEPDSGAVQLGRVAAAVDSGEAVNPDGMRNQIEGSIVQASSWTLLEHVRFDRRRITSRDWNSYPILRFASVPESVEVEVIDRPGTPFLGTGEAGQGPASAAIANALASALGVRLRDLPLSADRIRAALTSRRHA